MTYEEHVTSLLESYKIYECRVDNYRKARANPVRRVVHIPKIENDLSYLVAMHEIGHIITNDKRMGTLKREAAAWKWVFNNALPVGRAAWAAGFMSLNDYLAQRQHTKLMGWIFDNSVRGDLRIPIKGDWFWDVLNELSNRGGM